MKTTAIKTQCSSLNAVSIITPRSWKAQGKPQKKSRQNDLWGKVCRELFRDNVFRTQQGTCMTDIFVPVVCLHKTKPVKIPTQMEKELKRPHSWLRKNCQLMTDFGRRVSFLSRWSMVGCPYSGEWPCTYVPCGHHCSDSGLIKWSKVGLRGDCERS